MTCAKIFPARNGRGTSTSRSKKAESQELNNRSQENMATSTSDLSSKEGGAMLKTAAVSFRGREEEDGLAEKEDSPRRRTWE
jgi:hypothetical protein